MTYSPGKHIYLAAPFFNDAQLGLCERIESWAGDFAPIYSPRLDGGVLVPDASDQERSMIYESNLVAIRTSAWVLAVIDDFDPGVLFEMGYAEGQGVDMLAYSDVKNRGLNVMLAGACRLGFINNRMELQNVMTRLRSEPGSDPFPRNTWGGEIV